MIEVRELTRHYGPTRSIEDLTFSVEKGEILGFLGPNGAGKSTTMRILTGLLRPTRGTARIGGFDVHTENERIRRLIGFLPEAAPSYPDMTLAGYLEFMAGIKGLDRRTARTEMERTTMLLNLQRERPRLLRNLSKGTRQRAAIAQALLGDPEVLLLDEPTVGLDPSQINDVRALINSFAGRRTVVLSTHILPEVEMTCTRIVIIAKGNIVAKGTPAELTSAGDAEFDVTVAGDRAAFEQAVRGVAGHCPPPTGGEGRWSVRLKPTEAETFAPRLARALVEGGLDIHEIRRHQVRLEDIFLRAIGRT